jgi:micrococcal nuclease
VLRVVDGDTIHALVGGRDLAIRLIGVDTPETLHPTVGVECYGPEAARHLHALLDGRSVRLVYDVEPTDRYGRTLAYVYRGDMFVNLHLVRRGYATVLTIRPDVAHAPEFEAAEGRARAAGRGLWGACPSTARFDAGSTGSARLEAGVGHPRGESPTRAGDWPARRQGG